MDEWRVPSAAAVLEIHGQLQAWLREQALPFWDRHGIDRRFGGFREEIRAGGSGEHTAEVRRGRVVARQIYVFDVGKRIGWRSAAADPIEHGCDFLFSHLYAGEGVFHTSVDSASHRPHPGFSLYEQAFYLFALARLAANSIEDFPIRSAAALCLDRLRDRFGKPIGGFEESDPPSLPLKANPHMHLLEAALAWLAVTEGSAREPWLGLACEIVRLCLTRFIDAFSGAIREYYDFEWRPMAGRSGTIVEPGHQFEWAWLLFQWSQSAPASVDQGVACVDAAERLIGIGERWGVDSVRGIAINELWDDMTIKDATAKLWPQTERLKAWCAMLDRAQTPAQAERAGQMVVSAAQGMMKYLRGDISGLWHEVCSEAGDFPAGPTKASSFYHVVCAIEVLAATVAAQPARMGRAAADDSRANESR